MRSHISIVLGLTCAVVLSCIVGQPDVHASAHRVQPHSARGSTNRRASELRGAGSAVRAGANHTGIIVRSGFTTTLAATNLRLPTAMAYGPDKRLYVSEQGGTIDAVVHGRPVPLADGLQGAMSLTWMGRLLFVSSRGEVTSFRLVNHTLADRRTVLAGLPVGQNQNNGIVAAPDGYLYLAVGATCNACRETDPRSGTVLRFRPDGSHVTVFARGFHDPYGLAIDPISSALVATDDGRTDLGPRVPDELNIVDQGGNYGWPSCWGMKGGAPCAHTVRPLLDLQPRSHAAGLCFYVGDTFPPGFHGDIFVAERGTPDAKPGIGQRVIRVHITRNGDQFTASAKPFATGFIHPIAVLSAADGSLLVADWARGRIYQIRWTGTPASP